MNLDDVIGIIGLSCFRCGTRRPRKEEICKTLRYILQTGNDAFRLDVLVENEVIIELKALEKLHESADAQILSHMEMGRKQLGSLINFRVRLIKQGITRFVKRFYIISHILCALTPTYSLWPSCTREKALLKGHSFH